MTNLFSCSEECGEVFGENSKPIFYGKTDRNVATKKINHIFIPKISNFHHLELLGLPSCKILAAWILAAKLPTSDLNFAVDLGVDFFSSRKAQKIHRKSPARFTWRVVRKYSLRFLQKFSACAPLCCKRCAVRPVFARVVGELRAADPSNVHGPVKQNASPEAQSEAPRRGWKPGQGQNPGPENQDNQHMLEQPRGSFPDEAFSS